MIDKIIKFYIKNNDANNNHLYTDLEMLKNPCNPSKWKRLVYQDSGNFAKLQPDQWLVKSKRSYYIRDKNHNHDLIRVITYDAHNKRCKALNKINEIKTKPLLKNKKIRNKILPTSFTPLFIQNKETINIEHNGLVDKFLNFDNENNKLLDKFLSFKPRMN